LVIFQINNNEIFISNNKKILSKQLNIIQATIIPL